MKETQGTLMIIQRLIGDRSGCSSGGSGVDSGSVVFGVCVFVSVRVWCLVVCVLFGV